MQSFKNFLKAIKNPPENDGVFPDYVHGSHASRDKKPSENSGVFPNYVHGSHANKDDEIKESVFKNSKGINSIQSFYRGIDGKGKVEALAEELHSHYEPLFDNHEMTDHVISYTSGSKVLNAHLIADHKGELEDYDTLSNYEKEKRDILNNRSNAISKVITLRTSPKDFNTYSGIGFNPLHHMKEDGTLHSPAFLSSSIQAGTAFNFSKPIRKDPNDPQSETEHHILEIPVKKGSTKGAYVDSHSNQAGEKEFIHDKGQTFRISKTPRTYHFKQLDRDDEDQEKHIFKKVHVWRAEPVV